MSLIISEKATWKSQIEQLTLSLQFTLRNGKAGKSGSSSLTSLIGGAWPLRRYSLKTKPDKTMKENSFHYTLWLCLMMEITMWELMHSSHSSNRWTGQGKNNLITSEDAMSPN